MLEVRHKRYDVGAICAGWGSIPVVFFPGMAGHPCPTLCTIPFPPRRTGRYRKGMISARPSWQGVKRWGFEVWDPEIFTQGGGTSHGARRLLSRSG